MWNRHGSLIRSRNPEKDKDALGYPEVHRSVRDRVAARWQRWVEVRLTAFPLRPGGGGGHDYWSLVYRGASARAASLRGPLLLTLQWSISLSKFTQLHRSQRTLLGRTGAWHPTHWVMVAVAIVGIP